MKRSIAIIFSFILVGIALMGQPPTSDVQRDIVSETYLSQVGVVEATGNNDGVQVEAYLSSAGLSKGAPWCAAFVNWCFEQNGIPGPEKHPAYSPSWFPKDRPINSPPERADVFGIYFKSLGRVAHVGFIDSWHGTYVITVEGNTNDTGSREGNAVLKKRRLSRQIYATCDWLTYKNRYSNG